MNIIEFCKNYIKLDTGPYAGLYLRPETQPWMHQFFKELENKNYKKVVLIAPSQSGKTTALLSLIMRDIYFGLPVILAAPTAKLIEEKFNFLRNVLFNNTELRDLVPPMMGGSRGGFSEIISFVNNGRIIFLTGEARAKTLAGYTAQNIYITELDGFRVDKRSGNQKYKEIEARRNSYVHSGLRTCVYLESTPNTTNSNIILEYGAGTESLIKSKCPHCQTDVAPKFKDFSLEKGAFLCPNCLTEIDEEARTQMIERCKIEHSKTDANTFSLFVPAFFNKMVNYDFIISKIKEGLRDPVSKGSIMTTVFAEVPEENLLEAGTGEILTTTRTYPRYVVPSSSSGIYTCGVDCDKNKIYYIVIFSDGDIVHIVDFDSISSRHGLFSCFSVLNKILKNNFRDNKNNHLIIPYVAVDSRFSELEVFEACKEFKFLALVGSKKMKKYEDKVLTYFNKKFIFNENIRINLRNKNGINVMTLETNFFKDFLYSFLIKHKLFIYNGIEDYRYDYLLSHLTAEERLRSGKWQTRPGREANHFFDALCYALALAYAGAPDIFSMKNDKTDKTKNESEYLLEFEDLEIVEPPSPKKRIKKSDKILTNINKEKYLIRRMSRNPIKMRY